MRRRLLTLNEKNIWYCLPFLIFHRHSSYVIELSKEKEDGREEREALSSRPFIRYIIPSQSCHAFYCSSLWFLTPLPDIIFRFYSVVHTFSDHCPFPRHIFTQKGIPLFITHCVQSQWLYGKNLLFLTILRSMLLVWLDFMLRCALFVKK